MGIKAGVLGCTGMVGQRFVQLLENSSFELTALAASSKSAGQTYEEVVSWKLENPMPERVREMQVFDVEADASKIMGEADVIFSALPSGVAEKMEWAYASQCSVFSKASAYRMHEDVPLLIPEINQASEEAIAKQRKNNKIEGLLCTDPNCSTTELALALAPLMHHNITRVQVTTMQGLSGAGYPGVASLDIVGNIVPYIAGEEEKIEEELPKIFDNALAGAVVEASCTRVPVREGHLESVFVDLKEKMSAVDAIGLMKNFTGFPQQNQIRGAPRQPLIVREEENRPQHFFDLNAGQGMSITIGRVRETQAGIKFFVLGHNTIRGAAGNAILNAECMLAQGLLR